MSTTSPVADGATPSPLKVLTQALVHINRHVRKVDDDDALLDKIDEERLALEEQASWLAATNVSDAAVLLVLVMSKLSTISASEMPADRLRQDIDDALAMVASAGRALTRSAGPDVLDLVQLYDGWRTPQREQAGEAAQKAKALAGLLHSPPATVSMIRIAASVFLAYSPTTDHNGGNWGVCCEL